MRQRFPAIRNQQAGSKERALLAGRKKIALEGENALLIPRRIFQASLAIRRSLGRYPKAKVTGAKSELAHRQGGPESGQDDPTKQSLCGEKTAREKARKGSQTLREIRRGDLVSADCAHSK
jgi:hypothetical protein